MSPKGRAEPLDIFELVGWRATLNEAQRARLVAFEEAMEHYHARRFEEALRRFRGIAEPSQDGPAASFAALCQAYLTHPPPVDWNGVFVQSEK